MILVDYRAGSCELANPLKQLGLPVEVTTLPAGDVAFEGKGVGGVSVNVGIEYKKLPDFIASVRSERLQDIQLTGMDDLYDNKWLFIEGELIYDKQGKLLRRTKGKRNRFVRLEGGMGVGELMKRLYVLHLCGGLSHIWAQNQQDTVKFIEMLYRTWTDGNLDSHRSHLGSYTAPTLIPISPFRSVAMKIPGVGFQVALAMETKFNGSWKAASNATVDEWASITTKDAKGNTRKLGKSTATKIVKFLNGEGNQ